MSPEQVRGEAVDERTDLFSLGVLLYEMATGQRPFQGETPGVVFEQILNHTPSTVRELNPDLDGGLEPILSRLLEKDPDRRYRSAGELRRELERVSRAATSTGEAHPPEPGAAVESLAQAKRALAEQRWQEAYDLFTRADTGGGLAPGELELLAEAAFWSGRHDECLRARERAFGAWIEAGDNDRAAVIAAKVAETYRYRQAQAVSRAWMRRAENLVRGREGSTAHGYVARCQTLIAIEVDHDYETALALSRTVEEIATTSGDRALWALAIQDRGRILVQVGQPSEGLALIDEAMTAALSGELPAEISGKTFCNMIGVCESLADYRRAGEWCQAASQWSEPHASSWFPGICRVHHAELLKLRGQWADAEREALDAARQLAPVLPDVAAEARYQIGEIELRRGEHERAEASFRRAHELGRAPLPGLALLRLSQGRVEAATSLIERALADSSATPLERVKLLPAHFEAALAAGDLATARKVADEIQEVADYGGSTALRALARATRGAWALASNDPASAAADLREALRLWQQVEMVYEVARTRELLARAYTATGCAEDARLELAAARAAFESLGASSDLERVRALRPPDVETTG